jgi:structural maintenance of chromosome 3 (chondroitin sulfate proteoglycan 6)
MNSLFHVVVENDDISTKIIEYLNLYKGGRVTFIPLNRVKVPDLSCPQSPDFVPLLKKLKYRAEHRRAFEQVLQGCIFFSSPIWCLHVSFGYLD